MSYHKPNITTINVPGIDGAIHHLQAALTFKYPWMAVFHRAYPFLEWNVANTKGLKVPKVWSGGNEYMNILPNDFLVGQAFFFVTEEEKLTETHRQFGSEFNTEVSLIVWVNTSAIPGQTTGPSIAWLKKGIVDLLSYSETVLKVEAMTDQDAGSVFDGWSIDDVDTQYLMLPYAGLRVNMVLRYSYSECQSLL